MILLPFSEIFHGADTCTIAIVMTVYFEEDKLQGRRGGRSPTDIATWQKVWDTAEFAYQQCVENEEAAGWDSVGKHLYPRRSQANE